jgi:hypothetical protein
MDGRVMSLVFLSYISARANQVCKSGKIRIYLKTERLTNSHVTK